MRLQILSDLHVDVDAIKPIEPVGDVVLVAGDVCQGAAKAHAFLAERFRHFIHVAGNHTFYKSSIEVELATGLCGEKEVHLVGHLRILTTTLWTDYELHGSSVHGMDAARRGLNDHRRIALRKQPWKRFTPQDARRLHVEARAWLAEELARPHAGPTVVMTHHAPHPGSIASKAGKTMLDAAYASDLTELIMAWQPELWVHGHVHVSSDYRVGRTQIVCNPHGYGNENPGFDPRLVVDL